MRNPTNTATRGITRPRKGPGRPLPRNPTPLILNLESFANHRLDAYVLRSVSVRHNLIKKILDGLEKEEYYVNVHIFRESLER